MNTYSNQLPFHDIVCGLQENTGRIISSSVQRHFTNLLIDVFVIGANQHLSILMPRCGIGGYSLYWASFSLESTKFADLKKQQFMHMAKNDTSSQRL